MGYGSTALSVRMNCNVCGHLETPYRELRIADFAVRYGFRLRFYQKGVCAIFERSRAAIREQAILATVALAPKSVRRLPLEPSPEPLSAGLTATKGSRRKSEM